MKEYLCLEIFDEQVEDLFDEDRIKANEIYQRLSSKWLAELRIPFSTIYTMQRVSLVVLNELIVLRATPRFVDGRNI